MTAFCSRSKFTMALDVLAGSRRFAEQAHEQDACWDITCREAGDVFCRA